MINKNHKGFALVELIVVISIVSFLGLAMSQMYFSIIKAITHYRERATISSLADNYMEIARNMPYTSIGTINGNPAGNLPDAENPITVTVDKYNYQIYYVVSAVSNDPVGDPSAQDYKQIKLYVKELRSNTINTFITTVAPNEIPPETSAGALAIKVYNAEGESLSGINIRIRNISITPNINLCRLTDTNGNWNEVGLPCSPEGAEASCTVDGLGGYHIIVNDSTCPGFNANYSVDKTYSDSQVPDPSLPNPPDATVYFNQSSYLDFQIDLLSNLTFTILNGETENCDPVLGAGLEVRGTKKYGKDDAETAEIEPTLYKYDESSGPGGLSYSNAGGEIAIPNMEWDTYEPALLGVANMIYGTSPAQPFFLLPDTAQNNNLVIGPYTENSLLVTVKDIATGNPINNATVNLSGTIQPTGKVKDCLDVNQTPGQTMFALNSLNNPYSLTVTKTGYEPKTIDPLIISGYSALTVELVAEGTTPEITHIITASRATSGGTISPSGPKEVVDGQDQTFTITPGDNFGVKEVLVDGVSQGSITSYTFTNVTSDHTIVAVFSSATGACSPVGATRACSGGGTQTCGSDNMWGTCTIGPFACTISEAGGNWDSPSTWDNCNGTYPQAGDSVVVYDPSATGKISGDLAINVQTANLKSFDLTNYTGILSGNSNLVIVPASGIVNVAFASGMTNSYTGNIYLRPATGATINFTTNGKEIKSWILQDQGGGAVQQQDDITSSGSGIQITSGTTGATWVTNSHNMTFTRSNPYFYAYSVATFVVGNTAVSLPSITGTATIYMSATNKFYDLSLIGGANVNAAVVLNSNIEITNNFTLTGANNTTQRLMIVSGTMGTQRKITVPSASTANYSNLDFRDIDFYSSAGQIDLSNIAGLSGDCAGNNHTNAIFTGQADQYWISSGGGNWSTANNWTSRVPLCQDNVFMYASFSPSQTVVSDTRNAGATIDWSGATPAGALTWNFTTTPAIYGSLTLKTGMTISNTGNYFIMRGRGVYTLTTAGVTLGGGVMFDPGSASSVAMQDSVTTPTASRYIYFYSGTTTMPNSSSITTSGIYLQTGAFIAGDNSSITTGFFYSWYNNARSLTMGSNTTWYLVNNTTSAQSNFWNIYPSQLTLNSAGSTIDVANNASAVATDTIRFGGYTYNNVIIHGDAGTKSITIGPDNNTFIGTFSITGKKTVIFPQGSTQTVANFSALGSDGNLVTIKSSLSGTGLPGQDTSNFYFTFAKSGGGTVSCDYLYLQDSHASPSSTWYAGNNSTDVLGSNGQTSNAGWIFSSP